MLRDGWWNWAGWPFADEWQAWWAFVATLIAIFGVVFAGVQLRHSAQSNALAAAAAESTAESTRRATRPYIGVRFVLRAIPSGDPEKEWADGLLLVAVRNAGQSAAYNVRLKVEPAFRSSGKGKPDDGDPAIEALAWLFDGHPHLAMLAPNEEIEYILDLTSGAFESLEDEDKDSVNAEVAPLPTKYEVRADFHDSDSHEYTDRSVLDMRAIARSYARVDPWESIARQMRRMNEHRE